MYKQNAPLALMKFVFYFFVIDRLTTITCFLQFPSHHLHMNSKSYACCRRPQTWCRDIPSCKRCICPTVCSVGLGQTKLSEHDSADICACWEGPFPHRARRRRRLSSHSPQTWCWGSFRDTRSTHLHAAARSGALKGSMMCIWHQQESQYLRRVAEPSNDCRFYPTFV